MGQVTLERFVKCVLWRCSLYVFVLPGYAQHILIISFGRVKFSSRLWHNTRVLTRRSIVRAVALSESSGDNCNSCFISCIDGRVCKAVLPNSNRTVSRRTRSSDWSRRSCSAARPPIDSGTIASLFLHAHRPLYDRYCGQFEHAKQHQHQSALSTQHSASALSYSAPICVAHHRRPPLHSHSFEVKNPPHFALVR
jgi:hypothetical protein